jgi:predicted KAP-like P-loop ATPase
MWPDNETDRDFLNFSGIANTVAEIVVQASGRPISIGISGSWGIGKSSMIKLTKAALEVRPRAKDEREFIFVEFNAWLYQGYDDARAALMDVIAAKLEEEAKKRARAIDKVKDLLSRIKWLRVAKLAATAGAHMALGLPPLGLVGDVWGLASRLYARKADKEAIVEADRKLGEASEVAAGLLGPASDTSPPKEIQALRDSFEESLEELGVTLVVLIDDLDRCLPETTISTLEAIRLFLFLRNTAFVIAADTEMIKNSVRRHFEGVNDESLITSYFDKLIQVPIRVPPLGTQDVRAYMILLYVDASDLSDDEKEKLRSAVCDQLSLSWQGKRVDRAFVESVARQSNITLPQALIANFDAADRLSHLMTTARDIAGNPRLIKRFLNAIGIRMAIAGAHGVAVDEAVIAKLLLFERIGDPRAYSELVAAVNASENGNPAFLAEWEEVTNKGAEPQLRDPWVDPGVKEWLALKPPLAAVDLRGALYVSREHAAIITSDDRLSSAGAEVLTALIEQPEMASQLADRFGELTPMEISIVMDRLLARARQEQEWGTPAILEACIAVSQADARQGERLATFLIDRPVGQIRPNIIPKIGDYLWAKQVLGQWENSNVYVPVKAAIRNHRKNGNIAVQ